MALRVGDRVIAVRRLGGAWSGWVEPGTKGTIAEDRGLFGIRYFVVFDTGVEVDWLVDTDLRPLRTGAGR